MTEKHVCTNESCPDDLHKATTGGTAVPDDRLEQVREQINRYFVGLYGQDYTYRAPETFSNQLEVWMLLVCSGDLQAADGQMDRLERMIEEGNRS